jgi:hypothetical protein
VSGGAVRAKLRLLCGLARHRRLSLSDRPSRALGGVQPEESEVGRKRRKRRLERIRTVAFRNWLMILHLDGHLKSDFG